MKKVLFGLAGLVLVLLALVLIVPGLIDWNDFKAEITQQAKALTGRDLTIGGDIHITVLPAPALVANDVALANAVGATSADMVRLKSLEIRVALGPLIGGEVQVETIKLVEPVIELEVMADGRRNWDLAPPGQDAAQPGAAGEGDAAADAPASPPGAELPISLDSFVIENGTLIYRDAKSGTTERVTGINARIAAASLSGPFESSGTLVARGIPLAYDVSVGQIIHERTVPFNLTVETAPGGTKAEISGTLVGLATVPKLKGEIKLTGSDLAGLIQAVAGAGPLPGLMAQAFALEGAVVATAAGAEIRDADVRLGDAMGIGTFAVAIGKATDISAKLAVKRLDLDKWLALPEAKPKPIRTVVSAGTGETRLSVPLKTPEKVAGPRTPGAAKDFAFPAGINGSLDLRVETMTFRGGLVRQARASAELTNGEVTINQVSAQLPGSTDVAVFGFVTVVDGRPRLEAEIEALVGDMRGVLRWLKIAMPDIPSDRLRKVTLASKFTATPAEVQVSSVDLQFDSSRLTGGFTVAMTERPSFGANLVLDRINIDAYLPVVPADKETAKRTGDEAAAAPAASGGGKAATGAASLLPSLGFLKAFDANAKVHVKTLVFHGAPIKDIVVDATLFNDTLTLRRVSVAKMAGASGKITGAITGLGGIPVMKNIAFDFRAGDVSRLFRLAGIQLPTPSRNLGKVALKGSVNGSLLKPVIDVALKAAGARATLAGRFSVLPPSFTGKVAIKHADMPAFLRALDVDYRPPGRLGGLDIAGDIKVGLDSVALSQLKGKFGPVALEGAVTVGLGGPRPKVTADLKTSAIVIDSFLPAKQTALMRRAVPRLIPAVWPGVGGNGATGGLLRRVAKKSGKSGDERWSKDPIDFSGLRAFDADIKVRADSIAFGKYRITGADLAATVVNGLARVERLTGTVFGGSLRTNAVLITEALPRIETSITVSDVDVSAASRALTGKAVAKGRMGATLTVATSGRSVAEFVSALSGKGSLALNRIDVKAGAKDTVMAGALNLIVGLNRLGGGKPGKALADVTATFTIERGIARSRDMRLVSSLGEGRATGTIDLPRWLIDVAGQVQLSESAVMRLITGSSSGPKVLPFKVTGALDAPNVKLETASLVGQGLVIPGIDKVLKKKGIPGVGNLLQKFLPGVVGTPVQPPPAAALPPPPGAQPPPPPTEPPPPPERLRPRDLLKGLLKGLGG